MGRLKLPASRVSAFRYGFNTPALWDDIHTYCCGAHFDLVTPETCNICGGSPGTKTFMAPGKYAIGTITGQYKAGGIINLEYDANVNCKGYFLVKLCTKVSSTKSDPAQSCFDRYVSFCVWTS